MDVLDAIRNRRSHRAFDARPVEHEKIEIIIESACWAPSPANSQPWEFIVISSLASREKLYELSKTAREQGTVELHGYSYIRPLSYKTPEEEENDPGKTPLKGYSFEFLKKVPVIVAVVGLPQTPIKTLVGRVQDGYKYACAAAIQNMLLTAHAQGLGCLWFTFFDRDLVRKFLNVDPGKQLIGLVCIGYPAAEPKPPGRYPIRSKIRRFD